VGVARVCASSSPAKDTHLSPLDAIWHLLNLFGPAAGMALITPALAKLMWWRGLKGVGWARLGLRVFAACALVTVAGLIVFGHDGKIATYAAMVGACTLTLWWFGFASKSH
jgi:hypothetical protein